MIIKGVKLSGVGIVSDTPPIVTTGIYANYDPATGISGSTFNDSSGNGFNATLVNGPSTALVNGKTVLQLTAASSQYYVYQSGYGTDLDNAFTFDVWARNLSAGTGGILISEWDNATLDTGGWNDDQMGFASSGTINMGVYNTGAITGPGWNTNNWYHIVMSYDQNLSPCLTTYVNGVVVGTASGAKGNPGATYLTMGAPANDFIGIINFPYFNGYIGAWKIYNRALTANEVVQNFAALRGRYGV